MRLGMVLPLELGSESPIRGNSVSTGARALEAAGFASAWFFDSIGRGRMGIEPLIGAVAAAMVTTDLEVGTGVVQVPLRNPIELAQRVLAAQLLCSGRLILGVGAGSTRGDFEAVGHDFDSRMETLDNSLGVMRKLWRGETVGRANLTPLPEALGGPPVVIGSWGGSKWIQRAATEFDGWIASGAFKGLNDLEKGIRLYKESEGKRAIITNVSINLSANEPLDHAGDMFHLNCPPSEARSRLKLLHELGFDDVVLVHKGVSAMPDLDRIRDLAQ